MTGYNGEAVENYELTLRFAIRKYEGDYLDTGEPVYDWVSQTGEDSDEWFESVEEAIRDIRDRYS